MKMGLIILAAGVSKRLGRPKQLLEYKGKPLLQHTIDIADQTTCHPSVVVLGANASEIQKKVDSKNLEVVINQNWEEGIASSIRSGLASILKKAPKTAHVLFLLSDQPYLSVEVVNKLISMHEGSPSVTACKYQDQVGVPAIFSRHYFDDLMTLEGDQGAKKIVMKNLHEVSTVLFEGGEMDVDTEENYQDLD